MSLSPICLFTYNRASETEKAIKALSKNELASESELFVFSDGPKNEKSKREVEAVRALFPKINGFKKVEIIKSSENKGLANSIISGVSQILKSHGKSIVLEDDLITSSNFLTFMNQALDYFEHNDKVFSVSGYSMDFPALMNSESDYYAGYRASSWGWATWRDPWERIDWDVKDYDSFKWDFINQYKFMRGGSDMPYMLYKQMKGKIDSWAIRWCYHQFKNDLLTIYPTKSKVISIGFGDSATHTKKTTRFDTVLDHGKKKHFDFSGELKVDKVLAKEFRNKFSFVNRLKDRF